MTEGVDAQRAENLARAHREQPFRHPDYGPAFEGYPYCRWDNAKSLFPDSEPSDHNPFWLKSSDGDAYSTANRALADRAIDWYRDRAEYPAWSQRIPEYPVPDWLHEKAIALTGNREQSFAFVEVDTGLWIEWLHGCVMGPHELRALVVGHLRKGEDPRQLARDIFLWCKRKGSPLDNPTGFFMKKVRDLGEPYPKAPRGPAPEMALTEVQRPDLSDAIPGWSPRAPDFDRLVFDRAGEDFLYAQKLRIQGGLRAASFSGSHPPWLLLFEDLGLDPPTLSAEDWLTTIRGSIDPARAKAKAVKTTFRR